jgi:glycosyltransferase involved in cell wall biosynthesis
VKIAILARALAYGGAERQLVELAKGISAAGHELHVIAFYGGGPLEQILRSSEVAVHSVGKRGRWDIVGFVFRLVRCLRALRPEILHSYLGVPNIVAAVMKSLIPGRSRLVWGIRTAEIDTSHYDWLHRLVYRLEAWLSRFCDLVIVNSQAGRRHAIEQGFPAERIVVIPNGIDVQYFYPDDSAGQRVKRQWHLTPANKAIGFVARLDPLKDHETFLKAAALLARRIPDMTFVCVGDGPESYRDALGARANELGIAERVIWEPSRSDIRDVYNAFNILCSASVTEGFPNVVAEAMACGVPCVVTDVGDSVLIVGDTGVVVPVADAYALAEGIERQLRRLEAEGSLLRKSARERIVKNFQVERLVEQTTQRLQALI